MMKAAHSILTSSFILQTFPVAIERDNPRLKGVLPKDYARPGLDKQRLGELIDVIATIELTAASEGEKTHRSVDLLGRVYEYFLTRFASAEGKNGGQFYTSSFSCAASSSRCQSGRTSRARPSSRMAATRRAEPCTRSLF
jgi:hypothetical protein